MGQAQVIKIFHDKAINLLAITWVEKQQISTKAILLQAFSVNNRLPEGIKKI